MTSVTSSHPTLDKGVIDALPPALMAIFPAMVSAGAKDISLQLQLLQQADAVNDAETVVRAMHSIKSCAAQLGGSAVSAFAQAKERAYLAGQIETIHQDVLRLEALVGELEVALQDVLAEL